MLVGKRQLWTVFLFPLGSFHTLPCFTCPLVLSPLRDHICQTLDWFAVAASQCLFHARVLYPALLPVFCLFAGNLMCLRGPNASLFFEAFNSTTWALQLEKKSCLFSGQLELGQNNTVNDRAAFSTIKATASTHTVGQLYTFCQMTPVMSREAALKPTGLSSLCFTEILAAHQLKSCCHASLHSALLSMVRVYPQPSAWFFQLLFIERHFRVRIQNIYALAALYPPPHTHTHFSLKPVPKWHMLWCEVQ